MAAGTIEVLSRLSPVENEWRGGAAMPRVGQFFVPWPAAATALQVLNTMKCAPLWIPRKVTLDAFCVRSGAAVAGAVCRVGIYGDTDDYYPGSLIVDCGTASVAVANTSTTTVFPATTLQPGLYWYAATSQGVAGNIWGLNSLQNYQLPSATNDVIQTVTRSYQQGGISGAYPATFSLTASQSGLMMAVGFRRSA